MNAQQRPARRDGSLQASHLAAASGPDARPRTLFTRLASSLLQRDWQQVVSLLATLGRRQALTRKYLFQDSGNRTPTAGGRHRRR